MYIFILPSQIVQKHRYLNDIIISETAFLILGYHGKACYPFPLPAGTAKGPI